MSRAVKSERHAALSLAFPSEPPAWARPAPQRPVVLAHCSGACEGNAADCPVKEACHLGTTPTVRRFPRTLNEAFPRSVEYGECFEQPPRLTLRSLCDGAGWAIGLALLAAAISAPHWWPV